MFGQRYAQTNTRENIKTALARELKLVTRAAPKEKLSFSLSATRSHCLLCILSSSFPRLDFSFFGLIVHNLVYINYEERQQGITRMNVVACGNTKHNKRWMDVKWIEQGSSERAPERDAMLQMTDNGIKNWCWKHFFISSSEARQKDGESWLASHQLEVDLKIKATSSAPTHAVRLYDSIPRLKLLIKIDQPPIVEPPILFLLDSPFGNGWLLSR